MTEFGGGNQHVVRRVFEEYGKSLLGQAIDRRVKTGNSCRDHVRIRNVGGYEVLAVDRKDAQFSQTGAKEIRGYDGALNAQAATSAQRTSACSRTVWVAFSCLSGG